MQNSLKNKKIAKVIGYAQSIWYIVNIVILIFLLINLVLKTKIIQIDSVKKLIRFGLIMFGPVIVIHVSRFIWPSCPIARLQRCIIKRIRNPNIPVYQTGRVANFLFKHFGIYPSPQIVAGSLILLLILQSIPYFL